MIKGKSTIKTNFSRVKTKNLIKYINFETYLNKSFEEIFKKWHF
jgi:hypothetical protein